MPRCARRREAVVGVDVGAERRGVAVVLDPLVRHVVAGARVRGEDPSERAADPVPALEELAGHHLGAGVLGEVLRRRRRIAAIDAVEVLVEDLDRLHRRGIYQPLG